MWLEDKLRRDDCLGRDGFCRGISTLHSKAAIGNQKFSFIGGLWKRGCHKSFLPQTWRLFLGGISKYNRIQWLYLSCLNKNSSLNFSWNKLTLDTKKSSCKVKALAVVGKEFCLLSVQRKTFYGKVWECYIEIFPNFNKL